MKKLVLGVALLSVAQAFAAELPYRLVDATSFDFAAPAVPGTSSVADKQIGMIIYDQSTNQFKGLNSSGNWDAMTTGVSGNTVVSNGTERIERVLVNNVCSTAGSCTMTSNTSGISGVTRTGTAGVYSMSFAANTFSAAPTCIGTALSLSGGTQYLLGNAAAPTTSGWSFDVIHGTTGTGQDDGFMIVCMGPR